MILSPTRELAIQIAEAFGKMAAGSGIRAAVVVGGLGENPHCRPFARARKWSSRHREGCTNFLTRELVNLTGVRILVLDEADRMLDMGFLPTIKRIMAATPADRQTLLFSATIETSVKHLVETQVRNALRIEVGSTTKPIEQVDLHVYEVEQDRKLALLEAMLRKKPARSWSSPAPSTAPTAWRSDWPRAAPRPPRFTATAPRTSATRR